MPKFLLVTVPFCTVEHRYYAAAYLAGIVGRTDWEFKFLDLNIKIYEACSPDGALKPLWNVENQVRLYEETKDIGRRLMAAELAREIEAYSPDLIGFSLMSSNRLYAQLALEVLAEMQVKIPVIYGGPDCFSREYFDEYFKTPFVPDIMLHGEAEIPLPEFLREFEISGGISTSIAGFLYRGKDGSLVNTGLPPVSYLKDDPVPADYTVYDYNSGRYDLENKVFTFCSKGCINRCAFCSESRNYQPYRRRRAKEVIDDVELNLSRIPAAERAKAEVVFRDSIFNASPDYVREICQEILDRNLDVHWFCLGGFRTRMSAEILDLMYRSGCRSIFFGFESASQRVVDLMGKNFDMAVAQQTIEACMAQKIRLILPIINGFPGEFTRDFLTSLAFVLRYRDHLDFGYSNTCGIFRQTPLSDYPEDFFITKVHEVDYELGDGFNGLAVRQLRQIINDATRKKLPIAESPAWLDFDLNKVSVAAELALIISFLCRFLGRWQGGMEFLGRQQNETDLGKTEACSPHLLGLIPGISLAGWFGWDKNSAKARDEITVLLDSLISELSDRIFADPGRDFKELRNALYQCEKQLKLKKQPVDFHLTGERLSSYDKGGYIIFEGWLAMPTEERRISRIEAKCGDFCFDIHHWSDQQPGTEKDQNRDCLRFWGKANKKMVSRQPLILIIIYSDNSSLSFPLPLAMATVANESGSWSFFQKPWDFLKKQFPVR